MKTCPTCNEPAEGGQFCSNPWHLIQRGYVMKDGVVISEPPSKRAPKEINMPTVSARSYEIDKNLFLVEHRLDLGRKVPKPEPQPVNHIVVIDCSGSMSGDLPQVRKQLKAKLPKLLGPKDTVTLIWFSGRGQFGTLIEAEPVATLVDLQAVHTAIDRWLAPIGLTGFREPIEEAAKVIDRVSKKRDGVFSLFFMSDGCDNQWPRADILKAVGEISTRCAASTFVEYGYYADRALLASMAEKAGGQHIFAEAFDKYEPIFDNVLSKPVMGAKRIRVEVPGDAIRGLVFAIENGDLLTFGVDAGAISVPERTPRVFFLSPKAVGTLGDYADSKDVVPPIYAAISLFATRMLPDIVLPLLKKTGDVTFIEMFGGCFGKQKYSEFMEAAKTAVFDSSVRMTKGYDPSRVPPEDAFTILDLLSVLTKDDLAHVLLDHEAWKYSRISRKRIDADSVLTEAEQSKVAELTAEMDKTKDAKRAKELHAEIEKILSAKKDALVFKAEKQPEGYEIATLTYNEERPNISMLVKKTGTVDLSARIGDNEHLAKLPKEFPTYIWRNYAIVKDGLVNVEKMPVTVSQGTYETLVKAGVEVQVVEQGTKMVTGVINLKPIPIINRRMVKAASAKAMFDLEWQLTSKRAAQKVYNTFRKELFPKDSKGYALVYGAEAATWLQNQGLTDYGGFAPKQVQAESTDFYMGKTMEVKLKGFASLPSVKDVKERIAKGKTLTGGAALMAPVIKEVEEWLAKNPKKANQEAFLDGKQKAMTAEVRGLLIEKAQLIFSIIVGQVWFSEWSTLEENTMTFKTAEMGDILGTIEMKEVEINI